MNLLILSGSQRRGSQTARVARHVQALVRCRVAANWPAPRLIDLAETEDAWWCERWQREMPGQAELRAAARWCSGLIFVVPEWSGMVPPVAKNFFLLMDDFEIAHKPGLIVGVSGGGGGAYPVQELRSSSYKNTRICWIPDHVIVREVDTLALGDGSVPTEEEQRLDLRLLHALAMLAEYMEGLEARRSRLLSLARSFPHGM